MLFLLGQFGQSAVGELRLTVVDAAGLPLPGPVEIASTQIHRTVATDVEGHAIVGGCRSGAIR